jgi:hypothetical protein
VELVAPLAVMVAKAALMIFLVRGVGMQVVVVVAVTVLKPLVMVMQAEAEVLVVQLNTHIIIIQHKALLIQ